MLTLDECYRILDLRPGATREQVQDAYRLLVKVWHPDRFNTDPELAALGTEKFKQINAAHQQLMEHFERVPLPAPPPVVSRPDARTPGQPERPPVAVRINLSPRPETPPPAEPPTDGNEDAGEVLERTLSRRAVTGVAGALFASAVLLSVLTMPGPGPVEPGAHLEGRADCPVCKGTGTVVCTQCGGTGFTSSVNVCPLCGGTGQRRLLGDFVTKCEGCGGTGRKVTHQVCAACEGRGRFKCAACEGLLAKLARFWDRFQVFALIGGMLGIVAYLYWGWLRPWQEARRQCENQAVNAAGRPQSDI